MNNELTAKLKISDYLLSKNIPCTPEYDCRVMITKIAMLTNHKKEIKLYAWEGKRVVITLSHILDEFEMITQVELLQCMHGFNKKKTKKKRKSRATSPAWVDSKWRAVRYKALKVGNGSCCLCGATAKDGVKLHVDHIKPKSLYPHLEYELSNLQVLCEDCNMGKSNKDDTDWR